MQLDQESEPVDQEALEEHVLSSVGVPVQDPDPDIMVATPSKHSIIDSLATVGNDLFLRPTKHSKYHNMLIMYDNQLDRFYYFILPGALDKARYIAATEDALWFNKPLSWIEIEDLMALIWAEEEALDKVEDQS
jgi:hypothetical protein